MSQFVIHTLILSVTSLDLLMHTLLDFPLQNSSPSRLVIFGYFEDMCRVDPVVRPSAHDVIVVDIELIDGNITICRGVDLAGIIFRHDVAVVGRLEALAARRNAQRAVKPAALVR